MKKFILYISLLLVSFCSFAQPGPDGLNPKREEKFKALYIAYVTQELNFNPDDAAKFWPVHEQYYQEIKTANLNNTNEIDRQQAVLNIKKKYQPGFQKILGTDRTNRFFGLEAQFRDKMIQRLKQMKENRKNGGGPNGGGIQRERTFRR